MELISKKLMQEFLDNNLTQKYVVARYFDNESSWQWFAMTFDGCDIFFGLVIGCETEYGSFSLSEFCEINKSAGYQRICLDPLFNTTSVAEIEKLCKYQS
jgi:hypothetical protein